MLVPTQRLRILAQSAIATIVCGALLVPIAAAQSLDQPWEKIEPKTIYFSHAARGWTGIPTVLVTGRPGDPRVVLVSQAVAYWNGELEQIGSAFRLGPISYTGATLPDDMLIRLSSAQLTTVDDSAAPDTLTEIQGDIIVALSDADFVSFTSRVGRKVVIGIRDGSSAPLNLPNVALNVITHELGHALGLGHNNDATTLMCGRPALCRPVAFESAVTHVFPITDVEQGFLLQLYPSTWAPVAR